MKIFGVGLSKTGTTSLNQALIILGYNSKHYVAYFSVVDKVDAVTDLPMALEYRELDRRYPDSKFILTVRDLDSWLKSCENHFKPTSNEILKRVRIRAYGCDSFNKELFTEAYHRHNSDVISFIPKDRLLVFDVREGWDSLCEFLGKDVPNVPFPHKNTGRYKK